MRRRVLHFGSALILVLCLWGHVSELFDHWDNTFRTGNDIEYSTVIVVLVAGAVIAFSRVLANLIRCVPATHFRWRSISSYALLLPILVVFVAHSPPFSLRI